MASITLGDRDRELLSLLREGDADVSSLAEGVDGDEAAIHERLPKLADNGLVHRVNDEVWAITDSGERTIASSPEGTMDERIDTPDAIEEQIESFDLRPDREEAVRNAFGFLQYWGTATGGEIVDGVYSENPAGFETAEAWWNECVRSRLADIPTVEAPDSGKSEWAYGETPIVDRRARDGRDTPDQDLTETSARFALERADLNAAELAALRSAFDLLVREGDATADELQRRVYPDHDAGYDSPEAWWNNCVGGTFESIPGVEQTNQERDRWEYRQSIEGPPSSPHGSSDDG
ncbi:hypothetical protein SAMN05216559_3573 [Halomicrobium zhouii]|uniref:Uncharacterized protein n=1 Tax=Halomicrobium zhouii TaxID=767519 RepID=A0A1I6M1Z4_9EURY|nr:winged helix-turn-helix domain-containing protein [Halomicrobium zhouii]SFS09737.1 hypothetical protein SAMN05216559_3573 [Halomicrobium zhouii]